MLLRTATFAMATRFELVLEARDPAHARSSAEAACEVIEECDARYSRFRSDSLVSRINREAGSRWVRIDPETFEFLSRCLELRRETDGAFDICVGAAMNHARTLGFAPESAALDDRGAFDLDPASSSVRFTDPNTVLDLGGIGKGHALDLAAALLLDLGVERALLHGGTSSVIALGSPPSTLSGWRVGLGAKFQDVSATLRDSSLSYSAMLGNTAAETRGSGAHIFDPRRAAFLSGDARAAVAMRSARDAEAWSTALLVLAGRESGLKPELARLNLPSDFECVVADCLSGLFVHAATEFDSLSFHSHTGCAPAR